MKSKYLVLIPIIIIFTVIILLVVPKNNYDYSNLEVFFKQTYNKKIRINLSSNEKIKLKNKLKKVRFSEVRDQTKCMVFGAYTLYFDNKEIIFDSDCSIVLFKNSKTDKYKAVSFPKSLKKYIIDLVKESVK